MAAAAARAPTAAGWSWAARAWWTFRAMGHKDVAILNGGLRKWKSEGRPLEDGRPAPRTARHFTPLKLTESGGIARKIYERDKDQIISRFGFAVRETLIKGLVKHTDSADVYYTRDDTTLTDGGLESVTDISLAPHKNIQYTGKLTVYKALFFSGKNKVKGTPHEDYWKAVDVNWENIVSASITKIITVNFYLQFLYDKQVELRGRLKETLGIGFVFKMI
jgi:hypothetical protein